MTRVKVCCISSTEEARVAVALGASALGLVSAMPSGPGVIPEERIAEIVRTIPPGIGTFLLTSQQEVAGILRQQHQCRVNTLQLCDELPHSAYAELRDALPGVTLVQVIHVLGPEALTEALALAPLVDALLLDSGNPHLIIKQLGGTGRIHDWSISRQIREAVSVPVFLAGGLNAGNVEQAIERVQPFAVDICSGVRTDGRLDAAKLATFFRAVSVTPRSAE